MKKTSTFKRSAEFTALVSLRPLRKSNGAIAELETAVTARMR